MPARKYRNSEGGFLRAFKHDGLYYITWSYPDSDVPSDVDGALGESTLTEDAAIREGLEHHDAWVANAMAEKMSDAIDERQRYYFDSRSKAREAVWKINDALLMRKANRLMEPITSFFGTYRFLSNFYPSRVTYDWVAYRTVEHAYQAAKCANPADRAQFLTLANASQAKELGRAVTKRPDWDDVKIDIMRGLLKDKFRHPMLRQQLIATGTAELIEGNTWGDTFWGVCRGTGTNHLGRLLMELRAECIAED